MIAFALQHLSVCEATSSLPSTLRISLFCVGPPTPSITKLQPYLVSAAEQITLTLPVALWFTDRDSVLGDMLSYSVISDAGTVPWSAISGCSASGGICSLTGMIPLLNLSSGYVSISLTLLAIDSDGASSSIRLLFTVMPRLVARVALGPWRCVSLLCVTEGGKHTHFGERLHRLRGFQNTNSSRTLTPPSLQ